MRAKATWLAACTLLLAAGCADTLDGRPGPAPLPPPTREAIAWADAMCPTLHRLDRAKSAYDEVDRGIDSRLVQYDLERVLRNAPSIDRLAPPLKALAPAGLAAADRLTEEVLTSIDQALPELNRLVGAPGSLAGLTFEEVERRAAAADKVLDGIQAGSDDLTTLTAEDPAVKAAHARAEGCAPPDRTPPRQPRDGTDTAACAAGACEVLIPSGKSQLQVGTHQFTATVTPDDVRFVEESDGGSSSLSTGAGGTLKWAAPGQSLTAKVSWIGEQGAVVDFATG
ncbi:hypothetical protein [Actinokineospora pegani]|uniref:hypothetical protein n=1 Tax=Actinokineospora pegani TaxID=2654637 RepID=UPI0012EA5232|nr:hypothetical protein [Actinokineospora pegani]